MKTSTKVENFGGRKILFKDITSQYVGIGAKLSVWSLLVIANIQCRKYIVRKCGGADKAALFFFKTTDDAELLQHKTWFILYWLGPLTDTFIAVLLLFILSSEKDTINKYIKAIANIFKCFYNTVLISSARNLSKK